jgi:dihydropteridine reductase
VSSRALPRLETLPLSPFVFSFPALFAHDASNPCPSEGANTEMTAIKTALVFGANGALGRNVLATFQRKGWAAIGIDVTPAPAGSATALITLPAAATAEAELQFVVGELQKRLSPGNGRIGAVVNAAGGWAGGGAKGADIAAATELMWRQSVRSSVLCGHIALNHGTDDVLLVITGSAAAAAPTPGMLAYGTAKAAAHFVTKSIAAELAATTPLAVAVGVCPVTIDTPGNRAGMPGADTSSWTPLDELSGTIVRWADTRAARPASGSLLKVATKGGVSSWEPLVSSL